MKRKSREKIISESRMAIKRFKKKQKRKYKPRSDIDLEVLRGPARLSFSGNPSETLNFFKKIKDIAIMGAPKRRRGRWYPPRLYVDLSTIKRISVPCAIVLCAELHRWSLVRRVTPTPRAAKRWAPRVRNLLYSLGAEELLGVNGIHRPNDVVDIPEVTVLKLSSGVKGDAEKLEKLQTNLTVISSEFEPQPYIFEGLVEAVLNAVDHAYDDALKTKYPCDGHRWWATGCVDLSKSAFRFFVYDQGVGIPATIASKPNWFQAVVDVLGEGAGYSSDARVVEAAFEVGKTQTGLAERGKGLNQMRDVVRKAKQGTMRVLSGRADVTLSANGSIRRSTYDSHIGGTLIEWSIPIDAF